MTKLVALLVEDDSVFALPAWHRTISLMERKGLLVTHVAVVPPRSAKYRGMSRWMWYLNVFGAANSLRLAAFAQLERRRRKDEPRTWEELSHTHGLVLQRFSGANSVEVLEFLRASHCDVLHVLAPALLKPAMFQIPRSGVISHHASMLPSCKGFFPYFWARMNGDPVGHTMHEATGDPGAGPVLAQQAAPAGAAQSMLAFHVWAAKRYPEMALDATQRLLARRTMAAPAGVEASYFSLPARRDRQEFERRGGAISRWSDLHLTLAGMASAGETKVTPAAEADSAYFFPDIQPLRVKRLASNVISMPRRPAMES